MSRRNALLGGLLLFAINAWIAWPLFIVEYTGYFGSVDPFFFAFAKGIKARWPDVGWWPYWNLGNPAEYVYQPLLHHLVAAVSAITGWSEARSFHATLALLYSAGPVTLYALVLRWTKRIGTSVLAGLGYSLVSPCAMLVSGIAFDMGGTWFVRRLQTAVAYGDGPYVTGLTLLPLAMLLVDRALEKPSVGRWVAASMALAAVPLTNVPAAISLAMALSAYALATAWRQWWPRWLQIAGMAVTGYALFGPWLPPSSFALMSENVRRMNPEGQFSPEKLGVYALFLGSIGIAAALLHRFRVPFFARFAVLFSMVACGIVLPEIWYRISLIGQAARFQLAMDMALILAAAAIVSMLPWGRRARQIGIAAVAIATAVQTVNMYRYSKAINSPWPGEVPARSEYKAAQWLSANAPHDRVLVPGSTSFWLNYWTDVEQMAGCCNQNALSPATPIAKFIIDTPVGAGDRAAEIAIAWMQALGVRYIDVSSEGSTEVYKDVSQPKMFEGVLAERWRDTGEAIYEVPGVTSIAHVIRRDEAVSRMPYNGLDIEPLAAYNRAVTDPSRPAASFEWTGVRSASIRSVVRAGEMVSVQMPFHPGWNATVQGAPAKLSEDALGLLLIEAPCDGPCEIQLTYDGGREAFLLRALALSGWIGVAAMLAWSRWRSRVREYSG